MSEPPPEPLDLRTLVPRGRGLVLVVLTIVAAAATYAAFPPVGLAGLAWVAPALLMLVLSQVPPRQGFLFGWLYGTLLMGGLVSFAGAYGSLPWIVLAAVMGLFYGLFGLAASAVRMAPPLSRSLALAGAWFLAEFLRGHVGSLALTFGDLAYSQSENLPLIQPAAWCGHYGVGFVMALLSAAISCLLAALLPLTWLRPALLPTTVALRRYNRDAGRVALAGFVLVIGLYAAGRLVVDTSPSRLLNAGGKSVRVTAVQGEGAPGTAGRGTDETITNYLRLSAGQRADVMIWPETALPLPLNRSLLRQRDLAELAGRTGAHLLVGAGEAEDGHTYNSVYSIRPDGVITGTYRKMDLVMFGEYVPGRKLFPFLKHYPIRPFDFTAGNARALFVADGVTFSPLICFEGIFPEPTRALCRLGAQVVVIVTSDAWARGGSEPQMHSAVGALRAIEARRYVIRAASSGRTAIYDPYGKVLSDVPCGRNGVATATIQARDALSVYHFWGDWPLLIVSLLALAFGRYRGRHATYIIQL